MNQRRQEDGPRIALGAGGEAKYHLLAFSKIRQFQLAKVYCRTESTRRGFCRSMEKLVSFDSSPWQARKKR